MVLDDWNEIMISPYEKRLNDEKKLNTEHLVITFDDIRNIMPTYVEDDQDALDDVRAYGKRGGGESKYKPMVDKMIELANDPERMIISFTVADNRMRARIAQALREIARRKKIGVTIYNVKKRIDIVRSPVN